MEHAQCGQASPWAQHISVKIFTEYEFYLCGKYSSVLVAILWWKDTCSSKIHFCESSQRCVCDDRHSGPLPQVTFVCAVLPVPVVSLVFFQLLESWDYIKVIASFKKQKQKAKTFDSLQGRKNNFKSSVARSKTTKWKESRNMNTYLGDTIWGIEKGDTWGQQHYACCGIH